MDVLVKINDSVFQLNTAILLVCVTVVSLLYFNHKPKSVRRPPGPKGLPIVGYLPFLGKYPERHFKELADKYGPVIGIQIGSRFVVVLNDFETINEVYRRDVSSERPPYVFYNYSEHDNLAGMNGVLWREHRKFFLNFLRVIFRTDTGLRNLHSVMNIEVSALLGNIEKSIANGEKKMNIRDALRELTNNVLLRSLFSITLSIKDKISLAMADQQKAILNQAIPTYLTACFPEWRWILTRIMPSQRILKKTSLEVQEFIRVHIEEHRKTLDVDSPRDYLDYFLIKQRENQDDPSYCDGILNSNCQLLLTGGADTTRTALEWMVMLVAKFPAVQQRIFDEIYQAFGMDKRPEWEDRYLTPFAVASIYECHRWKTIVPLTSLRLAKEDLPVKDYVIPKGALFIGNVWTVHNDEPYWKDPSDFNPERYLNKDGKVNLNERQLAFSVGKRDCPGKQQALVEQYTVLVGILQKYKILPPPEGISLEDNDDLVVGPISPVVVFEPRSSKSS